MAIENIVCGSNPSQYNTGAALATSCEAPQRLEPFGRKKLRYKLVKDYDSMSDEITTETVSLIKQKPDAVMVIPGCNTPLGFYKRLSAKVREGQLDISGIRFVTVDSPIDLRLSDPRNFRMFMYTHFYRYIFGDIPETADKDQYLKEFYSNHPNLIVPYVQQNATKAEAGKTANEFGKKLEQLGWADLAILGLGKAAEVDGELVGGHIAFNEPGSKIDSKSRIIELAEHTIDVKFKGNKHLWKKDYLDLPCRAITLGIYEILQSKKIILAASGPHKSKEVKRLLEGEISSNFPATYLHKAWEKTLAIIDRESAQLLHS